MAQMRRNVTWALLALIAGASTAATPPNAEPVALRKLPVAVPGRGFQAIRADLNGRALVITDELEVFELAGTRTLRPTRSLASDDGPARPFVPALSPDGDSWLLRAESGRVLLFDDEKGVPLPQVPLPPEVLGFSGSDPVIGAVLAEEWLRYLPEEDRDEPPFLWRLDGSDWAPLLRTAAPDPSAADVADLPMRTSAILASDTRDRIWVASELTYDIRKLSPSGRELVRVHDPARSEPPKATSEQQQELDAALAAKGIQPERVTTVVAVPDAVVRGLAAWQGDAYALVSLPGVGYAVDRVDGATGEVSRARIAVERPEILRTLAATSDGLLLAAARASDGIWSVAWTDLDPAWRPVAELAKKSTESAGDR